MKGLELLIISLLIILCKQVQQVIGIPREFFEIVSDPINLSVNNNRVVQDAALPMVLDEVSVTLQLNILSHDRRFTCVFHKGDQDFVRTPSLYLTPNISAPHVRYSASDNQNEGISSVGDGLNLNRWYNIAYTLSEPEKRLDFYIDGQLVGFQNFLSDVVFNNGPLFIGTEAIHSGITGQISKFRYYNWRLSAEEVMEEHFGITPSTTSTQPTKVPQPENVPKFNHTAAMVGIGVGASLASISLTVLGFYLFKLYKKKYNQNRHSKFDGILRIS